MAGQFLTYLPLGWTIEMATTLAIMKRLKETGHLDYPFGKLRQFTRKLDECQLTDPDVALSIASYQDFDSVQLDALSVQHHGRAAMHDGDVGPATMALFDLERCMCPDYGPTVAAAYSTAEAIGSGPWKGCHGIGDFHSAIVKVSEANMPAHLKQEHKGKTVWHEILRLTQQMYAEIGLWFVFINEQGVDYLTGKKVEGAVQTELSFVTSSDGWIGLAIVGSGNMTCSSTAIWLRLLASFGRGYSIEQLIADWVSLLAHELGHNCGFQHLRGSVMNSTLIAWLKGSWLGDPLEAAIKRAFGGIRVPSVGPGPTPGPDPTPPVSGKIWIRGPIEVMQGETPLGKFILTPASGA